MFAPITMLWVNASWVIGASAEALTDTGLLSCATAEPTVAAQPPSADAIWENTDPSPSEPPPKLTEADSRPLLATRLFTWSRLNMALPPQPDWPWSTHSGIAN